MAVLGIGGLFFRAQDPDALSAWYKEKLGVGAGCNVVGDGDANEWFWNTVGGPVVFAPFNQTTDYFPAANQFMINLRVSELGALLESLKAAGVDSETREEWDSPETGKFARIHDPEGNPIELWEPPAG